MERDFDHAAEDSLQKCCLLCFTCRFKNYREVVKLIVYNCWENGVAARLEAILRQGGSDT